MSAPEGLTISAKIGIGIGAAVGLLITVLIVLLAFWFRRKKKDLAMQDEGETQMPHGFMVHSVVPKKFRPSPKASYPVEVESSYDKHYHIPEAQGDSNRPPAELG